MKEQSPDVLQDQCGGKGQRVQGWGHWPWEEGFGVNQGGKTTRNRFGEKSKLNPDACEPPRGNVSKERIVHPGLEDRSCLES